MSIVRTASEYPGGLEELLLLVRYFEGESSPWQAVARAVAQRLPNLKIDPAVTR